MPHNIVFIGASYGALPAAHGLLRDILPKLQSSNTEKQSYRVILISPSADFYWKVGSPRTIANPELLPIERVLLPIAPEFAKYGADRFEFVQARAERIDHTSRTIFIRNGSQSIKYDTLIIASGTNFVSPIWSVGTAQGADATVAALKDIHARLPAAKSVLVGGGGAAGVETAGELGHKYGKTKNITLLSGSTQLLHRLQNKKVGRTAEHRLSALGIKTINGGLKVQRSTRQGDKDVLEMSDGSTMTVDVYIEATGDRPNTSFVPPEWLNERKYVKTVEKTLALDVPGVEDVYCIGSVGSYSDGSILDCKFAMPALLESLRLDLSAKAGQAETKARKVYYKKIRADMQFVPIGPSGGVAVVFGWQMPSFMVWLLKSRDFMISLAIKTANGTA